MSNSHILSSLALTLIVVSVQLSLVQIAESESKNDRGNSAFPVVLWHGMGQCDFTEYLLESHVKIFWVRFQRGAHKGMLLGGRGIGKRDHPVILKKKFMNG